MIIFAIIADRLRFVTKAECTMHCKNDDYNWFDEHYNDSKAQFWGCSLVCFILGAYTIIGSVYLYNTVEVAEQDKKQQ